MTVYCKDCKHFDQEDKRVAPLCINTRLGRNLVTGNSIYRWCHIARDAKNMCGVEGKWYEEKV